MNNVVANTALKTILAVIIALFIAFGIAALGFPQHMATMFENMGAYSFATGFSSLRYTYTREIGDLARCVEDSILDGDDSNVASFGGRLLADPDEFDSYSATRTDGVWEKYDYRQYILGAIASARYNTGDKEGAIAAVRYALDSVTGFPVPNAAGNLAEALTATTDTDTKAKLYDIVSSRTPEEGQEIYYTSVLKALSN